MMLESPVQRNLHAGFGGRHSEKGSHAPRWVPTLLFQSLERGVCGSDAFRSSPGARQTIFAYLECFSNRVRRHSTLQYVNPVEFEQQRGSFPSFLPPKKSCKPTARWRD